jgi:hypothetical protein
MRGDKRDNLRFCKLPNKTEIKKSRNTHVDYFKKRCFNGAGFQVTDAALQNPVKNLCAE